MKAELELSCVVYVRDLVGWVCNVSLINAHWNWENPRGVGILGGRVQGPGEEQGELVYKQPETEVDDSCHR
jgi:hypothetical protein